MSETASHIIEREIQTIQRKLAIVEAARKTLSVYSIEDVHLRDVAEAYRDVIATFRKHLHRADRRMQHILLDHIAQTIVPQNHTHMTEGGLVDLD